jgi:hypothetical protein
MNRIQTGREHRIQRKLLRNLLLDTPPATTAGQDFHQDYVHDKHVRLYLSSGHRLDRATVTEQRLRLSGVGASLIRWLQLDGSWRHSPART